MSGLIPFCWTHGVRVPNGDVPTADSCRVAPGLLVDGALLEMVECDNEWCGGGVVRHRLPEEAAFGPPQGRCPAACRDGWVVKAPTVEISQMIAAASARQGIVPPRPGSYAVVALPDKETE